MIKERRVPVRRVLPVSLAAMLVMAIFMLSACDSVSTLQATVEPIVAEVVELATAQAGEAGAAEPASEDVVEPAAEHSGGAVHFTYEGEAGPENWAGLSPDFAACDDAHQSPIDLAGAEPQDVANLVFNYQPSAINIKNNGHTVQVDYDAGSTIELDGQRYKLAQFHFHAPSEHTIDGQPAAAELHLVHVNDDGTLPVSPKVVVGILIQAGAENTALSAVWDSLYAANATPQPVDGMVNAADLLPAVQTRYRYSGSLTTPPCTEGIDWNVMTDPIEMSQAQLDAFTALFEGGTNRPVQPINDRDLALDSTP